MRTFTYEAEQKKKRKKLGTHPDDGAAHRPRVVNVVVVDPFEEEKEGIGIASDAQMPQYLRPLQTLSRLCVALQIVTIYVHR